MIPIIAVIIALYNGAYILHTLTLNLKLNPKPEILNPKPETYTLAAKFRAISLGFQIPGLGLHVGM